MSNSQTCPECNGKGWIDMSCAQDGEARTCGLCNGSGVNTAGKTCPGCQGTGRIEVRTVDQQKCLKCNGTGEYPPPEDL